MPLICHLNQRGRYECNLVNIGGSASKDATIHANGAPKMLPWLGIMKRFIPNSEYSSFDSILRMPPHESTKGAEIVDSVFVGDFVAIVNTSNIEHVTRMVFMYSSEHSTIDDFGYTENGTFLSRPDTFITTTNKYRLHAPLHLTGDYPEFIRIERIKDQVTIQTSDSHVGLWTPQHSFMAHSEEKIIIGVGFIRTFPCEQNTVWRCYGQK